jgi:hypothetical protein
MALSAGFRESTHQWVPTEYDSALIEKLFPIAQVSVGNPRSFLMAHLTKCLYVCIVHFGLAQRASPGRGVVLGSCRQLPPRILSATQLDAMNRHRALLRNSRVGVQNGTDSSFLPLHHERGDAP